MQGVEQQRQERGVDGDDGPHVLRVSGELGPQAAPGPARPPLLVRVLLPAWPGLGVRQALGGTHKRAGGGGAGGRGAGGGEGREDGGGVVVGGSMTGQRGGGAGHGPQPRARGRGLGRGPGTRGGEAGGRWWARGPLSLTPRNRRAQEYPPVSGSALPSGLSSPCRSDTIMMSEVYRPLRHSGHNMTFLIDDVPPPPSCLRPDPPFAWQSLASFFSFYPEVSADNAHMWDPSSNQPGWLEHMESLFFSMLLALH